MQNLARLAEQFRRLHDRSRPLILPNAWDVASARIFEEIGFEAVATTSAGVAAVLGYPDGQHIGRNEMARMVQRIASAVKIPVSADMEAGYGSIADTVRDVVDAGAVGLNLEDGTRDPNAPLVPIETQLERIREARKTANDLGVPVVINARVDVFLARVGDELTRLPATIERGSAYADAGADCIFVPGVVDRDTIRALATALRAPLNVLATAHTPPPAALAELGVARVTFGSGLFRTALGEARSSAQALFDGGGFGFLADAIAHTEVNRLFRPSR